MLEPVGTPEQALCRRRRHRCSASMVRHTSASDLVPRPRRTTRRHSILESLSVKWNGVLVFAGRGRPTQPYPIRTSLNLAGNKPHDPYPLFVGNLKMPPCVRIMTLR